MYYYHYDALGSIVALSQVVGGNGVLVESYLYDSFGYALVYDGSGNFRSPNQSLYKNPFLFTGRQFDIETGLYYYRARMYSPLIGRFLQTDLIGYAGGVNLYGYCFNNPINWIDPYGYDAWGAFWSWVAGCGWNTDVELLAADNMLLAKGFAEGAYDGAAIAANEYTFHKIPRLNKIASQKVSEYGAAGKASQFLAGLSRDAAIAAAGDVAFSKAANLIKGAKVFNTGKTTVYSSVNNGVTNYVGITDDIATRAGAQARKGLEINPIKGLTNLSRSDARAVEQVLIEHHGLAKKGGTLINKINGIAKNNPIYQDSVARGTEILRNVAYPGF